MYAIFFNTCIVAVTSFWYTDNMHTRITKLGLLFAIASYTFFAFSPLAAHVGMAVAPAGSVSSIQAQDHASHTMGTQEAHAEHTALQQESEHTGHGSHTIDCVGLLCTAAPVINWDCLQHCLQAATHNTPVSIEVMTFLQLFVVIAASVVIVLLIAPRKNSSPPQWHWYRPLYLFNTVRLLE